LGGLVKAIEAKAQERELAGKGKDGSGGRGRVKKDENPTDHGQEGLVGETSKVLGELAGVSGRTVYRVKAVMERGTEEQKENMRTGRSSARAEFDNLRNDLVALIEKRARERQAHGKTAPGKTLTQVPAEATQKGESNVALGEAAGVSKERKAQASGQPLGAKKSLTAVPPEEKGETAEVLAAAAGQPPKHLSQQEKLPPC